MNFAKLYSSYELLSEAKDNFTELGTEYKVAINATKGSEKEKQLAAQIISKFFKHFPDYQNDAVEAIFDLCEDDDMSIRIAAIKTLPSFCKESNKYNARVADISAQLLQLEDPQEHNIASSTLLQVLKDDPTTVLKSMFKLINDKTTELQLREKMLKFILTKVKTMDKAVFTAELEELLLTEVKSTLQDCTAEEYILLMNYLVSSKYCNTITAQQELIDIACEQIEMDQKFNPLEEDSNNTDKLITCVKFILPFFSAKIESSKFILFYCDQVLSQWETIGNLELGTQYQLAIAQQLAEMSMYCGNLETPSTQIVQIFDKLKMYMPYPPEDTSSTKMPEFNFSVVESLLFTFHRLARQSPDFLTCDQSVLKDFRSRLMYFSRGVQGCLKVLNLTDKEKIFSPEEKKVREMSPKLLNNINTLIKDLFYQPPIYKCNVSLSFKLETKKTNVTKSPEIGTKRHVPIFFESNGASNNKQSKQSRNIVGEKRIYTPPSGKFSHNFHNREGNNRFWGGRGGPSRGSRGRGRGAYRN